MGTGNLRRTDMTLIGLKRDVQKVKAEVAALRPSFSAGALTNHTTRGVTRTPITFGAQLNQSTTTNGNRWA
jgi:hypothetical protein